MLNFKIKLLDNVVFDQNELISYYDTINKDYQHMKWIPGNNIDTKTHAVNEMYSWAVQSNLKDPTKPCPPYHIDAGEEIIFTTNIDHDGSIKVPVNYANLHKDLRVDDLIMADDGTLSFSVLAITDQDIHCKALMRGQIKSRKGINVPFVKLNTPIITARDEEMIEFACANNVDYVGISFVESASHVRKIQSLLDGRGPKVVAKIENQGGLNATEEIIQAADMVMIDRGDLSVETSLYDIAIKQKKIIECSKKYNVPVIVATEMLHSMISQPVPTKAEICDISNAVLDGCSLTMLSGETAIGLFPFEALATMRKVIEASENYLFLKK